MVVVGAAGRVPVLLAAVVVVVVVDKVDKFVELLALQLLAGPQLFFTDMQ